MKFSRKLLNRQRLLLSCVVLFCHFVHASVESRPPGQNESEGAGPAQPVSKQKINIAVAANFAPVLKDIVKTYQETAPHELVIISGSTGKLYTQVTHGAPFDLFLSADQEHPRKLVDAEMADAGSLYTYAEGAIVLWSLKWPSESAKQHLMQGSFSSLAIANPKIAPYGLAAKQAMDAMGVTMSAEQKLLQGENIAQTFHFVRFGNADLGFVSLSQIKQYEQLHGEKASYWRVPRDHYQTIRQDLVILERGAKDREKREAIEHFLEYLQSEAAQQRMQFFGYETP